jgi:VRR-NUC domain
MARTPESIVKADVKKLLKARGIWYYLPVSNGMGQHGIPDFICCVPPTGKFLAIETKAPGKIRTVTPLQERAIGNIREARGWAIVIDDVLNLIDFLDEVAPCPTK